ncbi:hypothetical protein [Desulfatitalea alkaliphila]|uniref:Uncharacterized protein n=1 Tax=Desulfatitalea alkaliphila TaxID=2929485 RepID=A0AA41R4F4_9BACT|nr:hypothetical protein [Desulfatitalea alkaliphila]MCJ8503162.1 hypothetical protein [Desulfatitalea alkaliphila]
MKEIIEVVYSDLKREWENGNYFNALAKGYFAPYTALFKVVGDFLTTDATLTNDDGANIEKIILAGKKANAKSMRVKINKKELTGADAALGKIRSKSNIKAIIGKESETEYWIEVEYA